MADRYILRGKLPVPEPDLLRWAEWFETTDRRVAETQVGAVRVSTVFIGLDHQWGDGPPLLFETMVFGSAADQEQRRYATWEEAERGHEQAVRLVQGLN